MVLLLILFLPVLIFLVFLILFLVLLLLFQLLQFLLHELEVVFRVRVLGIEGQGAVVALERRSPFLDFLVCFLVLFAVAVERVTEVVIGPLLQRQIRGGQ